jgi:hypothetical protein
MANELFESAIHHVAILDDPDGDLDELKKSLRKRFGYLDLHAQGIGFTSDVLDNERQYLEAFYAITENLGTAYRMVLATELDCMRVDLAYYAHVYGTQNTPKTPHDMSTLSTREEFCAVVKKQQQHISRVFENEYAIATQLHAVSKSPAAAHAPV